MPDQEEVLAKSTLRAAKELQLTTAQYADVLSGDVPDPNGVNIAGGGARIDPHSERGNRALRLIQIYQLLYAQTGNNRAAMAHWMHTKNKQLGSRPVDLVGTTRGLEQIKAYLESLTS